MMNITTVTKKSAKHVLAIFLFALVLLASLSLPAHAALGDFLDKWGGETLSHPNGIAVDSSGNVYVADGTNNRIEVFSSTGVFLRRWGSTGSGNGQFNNGPQAIAVDSNGNVYVGEFGPNNRVQVFSGSTGTYLRTFGSSGYGDSQFQGVSGIAVDSSGNVYVADTNNNKVKKFNSNGDFITKWGGSTGTGDGDLYYPRGVTVDPSGDYVYVTDGGNHNSVQKFTNTGTFVTKIGSSGTGGSGVGQFNMPYSIAVDGDGNIYVDDMNNHRVQVFRNDGTFLRTWGSLGSGDGQMRYPAGIALDFNGKVCVSDTLNHRVQVFENTGAFVRDWGSPSSDGSFNAPRNLTVDPSGNVYVADTGYNRVQVFDDTKSFVNEWYGQLSSPSGVALDSDGNVYVTDTSNHRIQVFGSDGSSTTWGSLGSGNGQFRNPYGIALDSDNNVYVSDTGNYRIQKFSRNGAFITKWGSNGSQNGQFLSASCIAVAGNGNVYVTDASNNRVQVFSSSTGTSYTFSGIKWGSNGNGDGELHSPNGIAIDAGGTVYIADAGNNRIQAFDSMGTYLGKWGTSGTGDGQFNVPSGVATGADGKIYVADKVNNRVQVFQGACVLTANAGSAQTVEQTSCLDTSVTLDGSISVQAGACSGELSYSWSWPGGSATGVNPSVLMAPGTTHVTLTVTNGALTSTSSVDITVRDMLSPVTNPVITGTQGANGWYVSDVNISLTASDACVKEIHYIVDGIETVVSGGSASFTISTEGIHTVSYYSIDNAGHIETDHHDNPPLFIKIDKTPPTIISRQTPTSNANGWNNTDVTVTFTCNDSGSSIVSCPTPTTLTAETLISGQTVTGTAVDAAGLTATTSIIVKIDKTPPVISTCYTSGVVPTHTATDSPSGKASESETFLCGNTNGVEVCTFTVDAEDRAGNTARLTAVYTEVYSSR